MNLWNHRETILAALCQQQGFPENTFVVVNASQKRVAIEKNQLFVEVRGKPIPYSKVFEEKKEKPPTYFLVYGTKDLLVPKVRQECLDFLLAQV